MAKGLISAIFLLAISTILEAATGTTASVVTVKGKLLLVDGKEFTAKGVALNEPLQLELLQAMGANTIRTYGGAETEAVLDLAQQHGLKVIGGLWIRPQSQGLDYGNSADVDAELAVAVRPFVEKLKDHPALLCWGVGNEMELGESDMAPVWAVLEKAAKMVRDIDPNHPTMAALAEAGNGKVEGLIKGAPSIQILGVNSYGSTILSLEKRVRANGWTGPIVLSEFGPLGHWQAPSTTWGATLEPSSNQKATDLATLLAAIDGHFQGELAFYWGNKTEGTATFHNLLLGPPQREYLPAAETLAAHWGGTVLPKGNRAPQLQANWTTTVEQWNTWAVGKTAQVHLPTASDPDGDKISIEWSVLAESGGPAYPTVFPGAVNVLATNGTSAEIGAGLAAGSYRLYVTAKDGQGAAAVDNLPFKITA